MFWIWQVHFGMMKAGVPVRGFTVSRVYWRATIMVSWAMYDVLAPAITEAPDGNALSVAPSCVAALLAVKAAVTQRRWRDRKAVLRVNHRRRPALLSLCASTKRVRSRAALVCRVRGGSLRKTVPVRASAVSLWCTAATFSLRMVSRLDM